MAKGNSRTASAPSTYELLGARVQRVINSPAAQKSRSAVLLQAEGYSPDDWSRILDESARTTTSPSPGATMVCSCFGRCRRRIERAQIW